MSIRFSWYCCGVVSFALLAPSFATAQCSSGKQGGGSSRGGSLRTPSLTTTSSSPSTSTMIGRNQLLLQQGLQQQQLQQGLQQRQLLQQAIAQQQQLALQNLLAQAAQQNDAVLQKALSNPNTTIRWVASQELTRRSQALMDTLPGPFGLPPTSR